MIFELYVSSTRKINNVGQLTVEKAYCSISRHQETNAELDEAAFFYVWRQRVGPLHVNDQVTSVYQLVDTSMGVVSQVHFSNGSLFQLFEVTHENKRVSIFGHDYGLAKEFLACLIHTFPNVQSFMIVIIQFNMR